MKQPEVAKALKELLINDNPLKALFNFNNTCCGPNGCGSEPNANTAPPTTNTDKDTTDGTDKE